MKSIAVRFCVLSVYLSLAPALLLSQDGEALYRKYCARCHEAAGGESPAPSREALREISPERILNALESGVMDRPGLERTPAERRAIADFLSDKPFGSDPVNPMPRTAFCQGTGAPFRDPLSSPNWNGWGVTLSNTRFQPAQAAGITAEDLPRLQLKWAFGLPGDISTSAQPVIVGGRVFVGSFGRKVYSLDAKSGCVHWEFQPEAGVRSAITIGKVASGFAAYFSDLGGTVYAVDAATGKQLWKMKVESYPAVRLTGAPVLHDGRLYVPVASGEERMGGVAEYECCRFRGSLVALDAANGRQLWKTYTISEEPKPRGKNKFGVQLWGPSGVGVWSAPTVDPKRNAIYVATGNSYSLPDAPASDAVVALDLKTGKVRWTRQLTQGDTWNTACNSPDRTNCPDDGAPDFDFGSSAMLVDLPGGRQALIAGQKSGIVYALDPEQGNILWQQRVGKGGTNGGIEWGPAADGENVYAAVSDLVRVRDFPVADSGGGITALDLQTGRALWHTPAPAVCGGRKGCSPAQPAAVTVIPGVAFSGSLDGHMRAYSTKDGKILWDYDTVREFTAVNGVSAKGGSINGAGPAVAGGMLFFHSGYGRFNGIPGNVLLAFSVDGK